LLDYSLALKFAKASNKFHRPQGLLGLHMPIMWSQS